MKNRRSTILVAIMVTLVGTPKVWQEFGNLFSALQHTTQNKLLNMVLSSQVQESAGEEISGNVQSEHLAYCPVSALKQVSDRPGDGSSSKKVKARRRATVRSQETLTARNRTEADGKESLMDSDNALAESAQNHLDIRGLTSALPEFVKDKRNVTEMASLPQVNTNAPVFIERSADFLRMKKVFEENKLIRRKVRCIISVSTPTLPTT